MLTRLKWVDATEDLSEFLDKTVLVTSKIRDARPDEIQVGVLTHIDYTTIWFDEQGFMRRGVRVAKV